MNVHKAGPKSRNKVGGTFAFLVCAVIGIFYLFEDKKYISRQLEVTTPTTRDLQIIGCETVIAEDTFETHAHGWKNAKVELKESHGCAEMSNFLGRYAKDDVGAKMPHKSFTVPNPTTTTEVTFSIDVYELDSWDSWKGQVGGDAMFAFINGIELEIGNRGDGIEETVSGTADGDTISFKMEHKQVNGQDRFSCYRTGDWVGWQEELYVLTITLAPKQYASGSFVFGFEARTGEYALNEAVAFDNAKVTAKSTLTPGSTCPAGPKAIETCQSIGDPHLTAFNGKRFDSHEEGWKTLFKTDDITVELEQAHFSYWKTWKAFSNKSWRITYKGQILEEGTNGVVPSNGGKIFLEPDVFINIWAANFQARVAAGKALFPYTYFVYISTANYEQSTGWCTGKEAVTPPPFDFTQNTEVTDKEASEACAELAGTFLFESCKADAMIMDDKESLEDIKESFKQARIIEEAHNTFVDTGPPPSPAPTPPPVSGPGVNGDPIIMGLGGQIFKFEGRNGAWYSAVSSKDFQWNMKLEKFEGCPAHGDSFTTGFGLSLFDASGKTKLHDVEINVSGRHTNVGCGGHSALGMGKSFSCLGSGSLELIFDGEKITHSVDHQFDGGRIIAFNTVAACSRRWFDFDISPANELGHLGGATSPLRTGRRRLANALQAQTVVDVLSTVKQTMVDQPECERWLEQRRQNNDLFYSSGRWSTIIIKTEKISFHIEYKQESGRCEAHNMDVWISEVDSNVIQEEWEGVIGETKETTKKEQHHVARSEALKFASDEDYEVISPFSTRCKACVGRDS